jgi:type II secretory pathway pseudopilin PulG
MMRKLSFFKNKRGESLLEVVVSLAIFSILATTLLTIILSATSINAKAVQTNLQDQENVKGIELDDLSNPKVDYTEVDTNNKIEVTFSSDPTLNFSRSGYVLIGTPYGERLPLKQFSLYEQIY